MRADESLQLLDFKERIEIASFLLRVHIEICSSTDSPRMDLARKRNKAVGAIADSSDREFSNSLPSNLFGQRKLQTPSTGKTDYLILVNVTSAEVTSISTIGRGLKVGKKRGLSLELRTLPSLKDQFSDQERSNYVLIGFLARPEGYGIGPLRMNDFTPTRRNKRRMTPHLRTRNWAKVRKTNEINFRNMVSSCHPGKNLCLFTPNTPKPNRGIWLFMFLVYLGSFHELLLAPTPDATTPSDPVA
ncbi:hypothetical protein VNO80_33937 [Phaseolus coccineus]|uniref:Uncharacterized protein n=1 Tax=Phaseolus coccineus TaxID=3886 RepID=A0AAN9L083_PHACN